MNIDKESTNNYLLILYQYSYKYSMHSKYLYLVLGAIFLLACGSVPETEETTRERVQGLVVGEFTDQPAPQMTEDTSQTDSLTC